jgi:eukaryotic-like serine/threonine-protein kinase
MSERVRLETVPEDEYASERDDAVTLPHAPTQVHAIPELPLEPGVTLGEYTIEAPLGEGGMGTVYAAIHPMIGKRAAVKVLKPELCRDHEIAERFVDEARAVNQIGHPNIVDIFSFGEMPDGRRYFVMEWLKGETLRDRLRRGRATLEEMATVIRPLTRALEAAHEKGIIHRDLKPENVFLVEVRDEPPRVKLLDFGVAKLAHAVVEADADGSREAGRASTEPERTYSGEILGTPMYIAPEQARDSEDVGGASDTYSLGAIAFELLTGRPPFLAATVIELITMHLEHAPVRPSSLVPEIPDEIDELVLAMLAKDPLERPTLPHVRAILERVRGPERRSPAITARTTPPELPAIQRDATFEVRFRSPAARPPQPEPAPASPALAVAPARGFTGRLVLGVVVLVFVALVVGLAFRLT